MHTIFNNEPLTLSTEELLSTLIGQSYREPPITEGVKLAKDPEDWKPDSLPTELGWAESALAKWLS